jgi:hypothetical protein
MPTAFGNEMSREELEWLLDAFGGQLESAEVDDQLSQARALRGMGLSQPQGRQAGRVYVAQNPLETIGATMMGVTGIRDEKAAMKRRRELNEAQAGRVSGLGRKLFGAQEEQVGPPAPGQTPFY